MPRVEKIRRLPSKPGKPMSSTFVGTKMSAAYSSSSFSSACIVVTNSLTVV
jgi:hypothetical protein